LLFLRGEGKKEKALVIRENLLQRAVWWAQDMKYY